MEIKRPSGKYSLSNTFFFDLSVYKLELHASQVKLLDQQCEHNGMLMFKGSEVRIYLV